MLDLFRELKDLVARLEAGKIDYALCGGLAMAVHGFPRATLGIDLLVPTASLQAVEAIAVSLGYTHSAAVRARLQTASILRRLCLSLAAAGRKARKLAGRTSASVLALMLGILSARYTIIL